MGRAVEARRRNALSSSTKLISMHKNRTLYRRLRTHALLMLYDVFFDADTRALEMLNAIVFILFQLYFYYFAFYLFISDYH